MKSKVFLDHFDFKMLINAICNAINNAIRIKGIVQPFELGGETRLIRSAVSR